MINSPRLGNLFSAYNDYCFRMKFLLQIETACNHDENQSPSTASEKMLRWTQATFQHIISTTTQLSDGYSLANVLEQSSREGPSQGIMTWYVTLIFDLSVSFFDFLFIIFIFAVRANRGTYVESDLFSSAAFPRLVPSSHYFLACNRDQYTQMRCDKLLPSSFPGS